MLIIAVCKICITYKPPSDPAYYKSLHVAQW